ADVGEEGSGDPRRRKGCRDGGDTPVRLVGHRPQVCPVLVVWCLAFSGGVASKPGASGTRGGRMGFARMLPPVGDETVPRPLMWLSASAAVVPMTIRAAPESRKPVLTPTLSMMVVAMRGAIAMAPAMPASHRPRAL